MREDKIPDLRRVDVVLGLPVFRKMWSCMYTASDILYKYCSFLSNMYTTRKQQISDIYTCSRLVGGCEGRPLIYPQGMPQEFVAE